MDFVITRLISGPFNSTLELQRSSNAAVLSLPNAAILQYSPSWRAHPAPNHKVIELLLRNYNFATVMSHKVNI